MHRDVRVGDRVYLGSQPGQRGKVYDRKWVGFLTWWLVDWDKSSTLSKFQQGFWYASGQLVKLHPLELLAEQAL